MGTVFLLTGLLAGEVQGFTRKITLLQQFFTPAGVFGHAVQRRLQSQPGFTDLLQFVAALAFEFFQIFVVVLMMNLIIAIMGDSYEMVKEHEIIEALHERAKIIVDMELLCAYTQPTASTVTRYNA